MYVVFPKSEVGSKIPLKFHLEKLFKAELEMMLKEVEPTKKKRKQILIQTVHSSIVKGNRIRIECLKLQIHQ